MSRRHRLGRLAHVVAIDAKGQRAEADHEQAKGNQADRPPDRVGEVFAGEVARIGKNCERRHDEQCSTMEDDAQVDKASGHREEEHFHRAVFDSLEKAIEKHHGADKVHRRRDVAVSESSGSDRRQQQHRTEQ